MKTNPRFYALLSAVLFGASAPLSKLLLEGIHPLQLAGLLYLGSGIFLLPLKALQMTGLKKRAGERLQRADWPWLVGAVVSGGLLGSVAMMYGLSTTPAATASMLLNFEAAATTLLAAFFFGEYIGRRVVAALALLTTACLVLAFDASGAFGFSLGAFLVLGACFMWGADSNFTRHISAKDPVTIVIVKGIGAGTLSFVLSLATGAELPPFSYAALALAVGGIAYGASLLPFIAALRELGSSRASALLSSAPFIGAVISFAIYRHLPDLQFWISVPLMLTGTLLLFNESHIHAHRHEAVVHDHMHSHPDEHHRHEHEDHGDGARNHRHEHRHEAIVHEHDHVPDIHHRHGHG